MIPKSKSFWTIDGQNSSHESLAAAKWFVTIAFTPRERLKYLRDAQITHYVGDNIISVVDIIIDDNGKLAFSKPKKCI